MKVTKKTSTDLQLKHISFLRFLSLSFLYILPFHIILYSISDIYKAELVCVKNTEEVICDLRRFSLLSEKDRVILKDPSEIKNQSGYKFPHAVILTKQQNVSFLSRTGGNIEEIKKMGLQLKTYIRDRNRNDVKIIFIEKSHFYILFVPTFLAFILFFATALFSEKVTIEINKNTKNIRLTRKKILFIKSTANYLIDDIKSVEIDMNSNALKISSSLGTIYKIKITLKNDSAICLTKDYSLTYSDAIKYSNLVNYFIENV